MKAVEFSCLNDVSGAVGFSMRLNDMDSALRYGVVGDGSILTIRYDNGQLCTFRRKTKGQNNE